MPRGRAHQNASVHRTLSVSQCVEDVQQSKGFYMSSSHAHVIPDVPALQDGTQDSEYTNLKNYFSWTPQLGDVKL